MGDEIYWTNGSKRVGANQNAVTLYNVGIDYDFIPAYDIKMAAGRNFSEQFGTDKKAVILNETAAKLLGFKDAGDAINQKLLRGGVDTATIVGVTTNFHQLGLQKNIDPMIMVPRLASTNFYSLKVNEANIQQTLTSLKQTWNTFFSKRSV